MANLAIVGTHSTNGVAQIHSDLLRDRVVADFAEVCSPSRFNNKTNGVTPRRWLLAANRDLSALITESIGDGWVADLNELRRLRGLFCRSPMTRRFARRFRQTKRESAKERFAEWLKISDNFQVVDPTTIFDSQIKRIHEYTRQLLYVLHVIVLLYNRACATNPSHGDPVAHVLLRRQGKAARVSPRHELGSHQAD